MNETTRSAWRSCGRIGGGVRLAAVELGQHLVGRVAAARAVAVHLPLPPQILRGSEEHPHVVDVPHLRRVVAEETLDDREALGSDVDRRPERAVSVSVDGLQDRLAGPQVAQMLSHYVHVVALGIERGDVPLRAQLAVVAVVVVRADVRDLVLAENADEAPGEGRLARRRVADDAEYGGPGHRLALPFYPPSVPKTLLFRRSSASIVISSSRRSARSDSNSRLAWRRRARSMALRILRPCAKRGLRRRRSMYSRKAGSASGEKRYD